MINATARWSMSLETVCPECKHGFDLVRCPIGYVWDCGIKPLEERKDFEVMCPACKHEFKVDFKY